MYSAFVMEIIGFIALTIYVLAAARSGCPCYLTSTSKMTVLVSLFELGPDLMLCGLTVEADIIPTIEW